MIKINLLTNPNQMIPTVRQLAQAQQHNQLTSQVIVKVIPPIKSLTVVIIWMHKEIFAILP